MRFNELFIEYKKGLKNIKNTIPFKKLPLYRKIFAIILFASFCIGSILFAFKRTRISCICIALGVVFVIIFRIIDSRKRNLEEMLQHHYRPYSEERINMTINVLKNYGVEIQNVDALDMLIEEAKLAQIENDFIEPLKKPLKAFSSITISIIMFELQNIGEVITPDLVVKAIALMIAIFSLIILWMPIAKSIVYKDYRKYNELIYDLRQIKLFYTKRDKMNDQVNAQVNDSGNLFKPDVVIRRGSISIEISNTVSEELLNKIWGLLHTQ